MVIEKSFVSYDRAIHYLVLKADEANDFGLLVEAGIRYVNNRYHVWVKEEETEDDAQHL